MIRSFRLRRTPCGCAQKPGRASQRTGAIVATLGTEFNTESGDLFDRILAAARTLGERSTVAIGRDLDPARFGAQPPRVRVVQHADFDVLVPSAAVVLHHGGSGMFMRSVLGAAPQIVFPMGADQPFTADQVRRLGIGLVLDPTHSSARVIAHAVRDIRCDAGIRNRVSRLRDLTLGLPNPASVVERLTAELT